MKCTGHGYPAYPPPRSSISLGPVVQLAAFTRPNPGLQISNVLFQSTEPPLSPPSASTLLTATFPFPSHLAIAESTTQTLPFSSPSLPKSHLSHCCSSFYLPPPGHLAIHVAKRHQTICWRPVTQFLKRGLTYICSYLATIPGGRLPPTQLSTALQCILPADEHTCTWHVGSTDTGISCTCHSWALLAFQGPLAAMGTTRHQLKEGQNGKCALFLKS